MGAEVLGLDLAMTLETGPFASEQLALLLRRLAFEAGRTNNSPHAAEVHDFRVAIRRFWQALATFGACFDVGETRKIKRRLRELMRLAGAVRDCDIAIGLLLKNGSAPVPLVTAVRRRRKQRAHELTAALKRWSQRRWYSEWRTVLENEFRGNIGHDPVGVTASHSLGSILRQFLSHSKRALAPAASAEKIHQFRLISKRLRYTLELFAPLYGDSLNGWIRQLRSLLGVLGGISDCEMVRGMIAPLGPDPALDSLLQREGRNKLAEFRRRWATSFSPSRIRSLLARIGQDESHPRKDASRSEPSPFLAGRKRVAGA